ncbi:UV-damaged DNA-binding protein rad7, partial [Coemansia aciculifera]
HLASVRLEGAFLVSDVAWAVFLRECGPRLRSFHVRFAGFGAKAMRALVTHCEALEDLRVSECTDFDDACLAMLAPPLTETEEELQEHERLVRDGGALPVAAWRPLSRVNCLDVGRPHLPMTSSTALRVVATLGPILQVLDLSGFRDIDDDFLRRGLEPHCSSSSSLGLRELGLAECNGISAAALAGFFAAGAEATRGRGLERLCLRRCYMLTDDVVAAVVRHSGASLRSLDLNSVDDCLSDVGLLELKECACLEDVDLSWVRSTSDRVLETVLKECKRLEKITVYGCPEVTLFAPTRPGLQYVGRVQ